MRINPDVLNKLARDTAAQRANADRSIVSIYLLGSLLTDEPLLGNTADIDLVCVHSGETPVEREIVRLSDDVHLDIAHHENKQYRQPRDLRLDPWLGPTVYGCKILYDPQHFMDFAQASVRGQFHRPDQVLGRSRRLLERARQIWVSYDLSPVEPAPCDVEKYLRAVEHAANAIAGLNGPPLTERRFLMQFPARAEAVSRSGLYAGMLGLLGASAVDAAALLAWLPDWQAAYTALENPPARLHPHRLHYYQRGLQTLLEGERPHNALWPLWHTWTLAACSLPPDAAPFDAWRAAGERLGLLGAAFGERLAALDAYLDTVEETLEVWGREKGA